MSTYKEIIGKKIKSVSSDPSDSIDGQMWYNTTTQSIRGVGISEAWSSSASLVTARYDTGGCGTQTANLIFGGSPPVMSNTEEYDGSGFSTGGGLGTARTGIMGAGSQTAGLGSGGLASDGATYVNNTEEYDGSTWSEQANDLTTGRGYAFTGGSQTAAWVAGGRKGPPHSNITDTEEYNGSTWGSGGALGSGGYSSSSSGPQTAGWAAGGAPTPGSSGYLQLIQFYDGSSWTNGPNAPATFYNATGSGTQTLCLSYGIQPPSSSPGATTTYVYDGSSFSISPATLGTGRRSASRAQGPSGTAALLAGGRNTPAVALTEEYNKSTNVITAAAWSSGGAMSTARQDGASFGVQTSAAVFCGETPSNTNNTEHYNGSSWTSGGNYPASYTRVGAFGVLTAGVGYGGGSPYGNTTTAEYNGSAWTAVNAYPISIATSRGCGVLTAGLACGGDTFPPASGRNSTTSKEYDGTNWTAGGSLGTGRYASMVAGTQTAAVSVGGTGAGLLTEEYNGSSWTTSNAPLISMSFGGSSSAGTQDNMTTFATNSTPNSFVQKYNGTSFATEPSIATGRYSGTGAGTAATALAMGGRAPPFSTATEEFTGETTAVNIKTFSTS